MLELESRGCARTVRWAAARPGNDTRRIGEQILKNGKPTARNAFASIKGRDGFEEFVTAVTRGEAYKILEIL